MMIKTCLIALFCMAVFVEGQGDEATVPLKSVEEPFAQVKGLYNPPLQASFDVKPPRVQRSPQMYSDTSTTSYMSLDDDEDLNENGKSLL